MPYKSDAQRRLMQAVAHNAAFADKVGIPQSVGRKFEEHKAGGGKVRRISEWLDMINQDVYGNDAWREKAWQAIVEGKDLPPAPEAVQRQHSYDIRNSRAYRGLLRRLKWDPQVSARDFELMEGSHFPHMNLDEDTPGLEHNPNINSDLEELIHRYGVDLPPGTILHRGLDLPEDLIARAPEKGDVILPAHAPQSTSMSDEWAAGYAGRGAFEPVLLTGKTTKGVKALPRVFLSQDEFMLPTEAKWLSDPDVEVPSDVEDMTQLGASIVPKLAKGGKIGYIDQLKRAMDRYYENLARIKTYPKLDPKYHDVVDDYTGTSAHGMNDLMRADVNEGVGPFGKKELESYAPNIRLLDEAIEGSQLTSPLDLYRGMHIGHLDQLGKPDPAFSSWTFRSGTGQDFASHFSGLDPREEGVVLFGQVPEGRKALPLVDSPQHMAYEGEVLLPRGTQVDLLHKPFEFDDFNWAPVNIKETGVRKKYAEGGFTWDPRKIYEGLMAKGAKQPKALPEKAYEAYKNRRGKDEPNALGTMSRLAKAAGASPDDSDIYQRVLAGFASQVYGLDEKGQASFPIYGDLMSGNKKPTMPGIIDEVKALPMLAEVVGAQPPQFAQDAQARLDQLHNRIHQDMSVSEPKNYQERGREALGVMAGQIPISAGKKVVQAVEAAPTILSRAKKIGNAALEWFTPTVEASPENYAIGSLIGGGLIGGGDDGGNLEDQIRGTSVHKCEGGLAEMRAKYAGGGKIGGSGAALRAIKDAISALQSGDFAQAASLLRPHVSASPEIRSVVQTLVAPSRAKGAERQLQQMVPPTDVLGLPAEAPVAPRAAPPVQRPAPPTEQDSPGAELVKKYLTEALKVKPEEAAQHAKAIAQLTLAPE